MRTILLGVPLLMLAGLAPTVEAQGAAARVSASETARLPFRVGERAEYQVKLGVLSVGSGSMEVLGTEQVGGHDTYHVRLRVAGGLPLARVDDRFDSWMDVDGLFSRRFKQDQKEISFERKRTYDFYPESRSWRRENGEVGRLPTDRPLDEVSMLYYIRSLPLKPGDTYTIDRYFKEDGNPVVVKVLRRETIKVPAGTFHTVVVQPIIKTDGLFGEGGEAEVYFTDDSRRILVQMTSSVPIVGSLNLYLKSYEPGGR